MGTSIDVNKQNSDTIVIVLPISCGLLVVSFALVIGYIVVKRKTSAVGEQESTDWNPSYGDHVDDYDDNRTQVMDRNVEYVPFK